MDPEGVFRRVCKHVDLDSYPQMLPVVYTGSSLEADSDAKGIRLVAAGGWQRNGFMRTEPGMGQMIALSKNE